MESCAMGFETLMQRKISLYQDLVKILGQEKKSLRETDVDALWRFSEKKQAIAEKIQAVRQEMLAVLTQLKINPGMGSTSFSLEKAVGVMAKEAGTDFQKKHQTLTRVKEQVRHMARVNKAFVEEYLSVLDEMIGIIANAGHPDSGYTPSCRNHSGGKTNLLLHKEV